MFMVGVSSLLWRGGIYFRIISHDGIAMVGVLQCVGYIPYTGCFFTGTPLKSFKYLARLVVSRPIYVNVDSHNLGSPYFNFLGGYQ